MKDCYIMVGIPASGKSYWVSNFYGDCVRKGNHPFVINRDSIREEILVSSNPSFNPEEHNLWDYYNHKEFGEMEKRVYQEMLSKALTELPDTVILDNMNIHPKNRNLLVDKFSEAGYAVKIIDVMEEQGRLYPSYFHRMNKQRKNRVSSSAINDCFIDYLVNHEVYPEYKDEAIIFDIDGTLAHNISGRSPYDVSEAILKDKADTFLCYLAGLISRDYHIIILSGRKSDSYDYTYQWLKKNLGCDFELYMRKSYDNRQDALIKKEIYKSCIEPYYSVQAVFDDRPQVVDVWNDIGLKCFACADQRIKF